MDHPNSVKLSEHNSPHLILASIYQALRGID